MIIVSTSLTVPTQPSPRYHVEAWLPFRNREMDYCPISTGVFPDEWKLARVVPVFKKGIRSDINNYRPISIIPIIAKVFEKTIYDQFYKYLSDRQ